ncbi:metallophosphoesterase [bacterium]|nr:metallophosphoesterase [bacterium]
MTVLKNWSVTILLTGAMLLGLQCYSSTNSIKFAQISDVHFFTGNTNTTYKMTAESPKLLDDAIEQINETPNISFVMFTGDQIDKPFEKELSAFLPHAEKLNYPWYFAFGNHDTMVGGYLEPKLYMQLVNKYNKNYKFEKTYYSFIPQKGFKVIVLDSIIREKLTSNGRLGDEQLKWLDNELKSAQKDTVLIYLHVPVIEPYNSPNHRLLDADKFIEILNKYDNPIGVFQGHYHAAKIIQQDNVIYISCPSLVTYPNAFRIITVTNSWNKTVFKIEYKETRLKNVQKMAKLLMFSPTFFTGEESDQNKTITIKR